MQHISKEKEVKSLRQQLLDFQVQSDEKTIIGMPQYLSVTSHINCIAARCLIDIVYLTACAIIRL